ncbi:MAG: alpha/beta hydrolase [Phycisphaerae bacterium]|nr:alpha/beta hydrolase [Phycisphaerae bacterium]
MIRIVLIVVVVMLIFFIGCQSRIMYHPTRELEDTPGDLSLEYQDVWLETSDGPKIHGWWVPADRNRGTVLFFHGNAGNISHRLATIAIFHSLGMNVLIIDYRGYGRSEGKPTEDGTYRDAEAAWAYLVNERKIPPEKIVVFGRSLGGALAVYIASQNHDQPQNSPAGLIAESSFTSAPDMAASMIPLLPIRWLVRFKYNSLERIPNVRCPVLIVHSQDDDLVPYKFGQSLYAAAGEPKKLVTLEGGHNDGFILCEDEYVEQLDDFFKECLPKEK